MGRGRCHRRRKSRPMFILALGVSGAGESAVGHLLTEGIGGRFVEGKDCHPAENLERMAAGEPLNDNRRWPWLGAVAGAMPTEQRKSKVPIVIAWSALTRRYRDFLQAELKTMSIAHCRARQRS